MAIRLFGLTGGIASGKSTVAQCFRSRGVPVIDADQLARRVVAPGAVGLQRVVEAFGPTLVRGDGTLDREALAAIVFSDPEARVRLNRLLHPLIRAEADGDAARLAAAGARLACYEAALLLETGQTQELRPIVLITASESLQRERIRQRNGWSEAQASARLASQMPLAEKIKAADIVIPNEGSLDDLIQRADQALTDVYAWIGLPQDAPSLRM